VWHSISYYAVNSHKIYLRTTHYKKTRSNYRYPKIAFYQGFLKILLPRRHSLEQRDRKGCGILSFSPILYMNLYKFFLHLNKDTPMNVYIYTHTSCGFTQKDWQISPFVGVKERKTWFKDVGLEVKGRTKSAQLASLRSLLCKGEYGAPSDLC
jgi:hypothetical protein